jgi:hypothetical protein
MILVPSQKYFTFQNKIYQPEKGVPMGSPISNTITEIFLQHFKDINTKQILDMKDIIYKYGNNKSQFFQHLLNIYHSIGPMENIMDITHITNKGQRLNTMEKFYIYKETRIDKQIND